MPLWPSWIIPLSITHLQELSENRIMVLPCFSHLGTGLKQTVIMASKEHPVPKGPLYYTQHQHPLCSMYGRRADCSDTQNEGVRKGTSDAQSLTHRSNRGVHCVQMVTSLREPPWYTVTLDICCLLSRTAQLRSCFHSHVMRTHTKAQRLNKSPGKGQSRVWLHPFY